MLIVCRYSSSSIGRSVFDFFLYLLVSFFLTALMISLTSFDHVGFPLCESTYQGSRLCGMKHALSPSNTGPKLSALSVACHLDPGAVGPAHLHCHPLVYIMWFQTRKMLGYEVVIHWVLCAVDVAHQQTKSSPVLPDVIGLGALVM